MAATLADIQKIYGDNVYPPYKGVEPFMENENGIGYQGVVLYNEVEDKIQCNECGDWFENLGQHTYASHAIKAIDYKDKFGLLHKTPLCTPRLSRILSQHASIYNKFRGKRNKDGSKRKPKLNQFKKVQYLNKFGLCDAQIAQRLFIVRDELNKSSLQDLRIQDIKKIDIKLYNSLARKFGSIRVACNQLGLVNKKSMRFTDSDLISILRSFIRTHKRMPTTKDFTNHDTYKRHFGSWQRALFMAGLDQLLAEVKTSTL